MGYRCALFFLSSLWDEGRVYVGILVCGWDVKRTTLVILLREYHENYLGQWPDNSSSGNAACCNCIENRCSDGVASHGQDIHEHVHSVKEPMGSKGLIA